MAGVTLPGNGISLSGACLARCPPPWRSLILLQESLMSVWFLQPQEATLRHRSCREARVPPVVVMEA